MQKTPSDVIEIRSHEVGVAHRYENMVMYVSLVAFLAMGTIFCLILSL